ncbi:MAG: DMT family transporter, partial [Spirochaetota bacterium]
QKMLVALCSPSLQFYPVSYIMSLYFLLKLQPFFSIYSEVSITFIKGIFCGVTNFLIGFYINDGNISLHYIPLALLIGIFSYGISIVFYVMTAQKIGAIRSQILFSTAPFWGILTAFIFLDETLSIIVILSFVLLVIGIIFTNIASHIHEHYHEKMIHIHYHTHDDSHHDHIHELNEEKDLKHTHLHEHNETSHEHKHYPDLHHRHRH